MRNASNSIKKVHAFDVHALVVIEENFKFKYILHALMDECESATCVCRAVYPVFAGRLSAILFAPTMWFVASASSLFQNAMLR